MGDLFEPNISTSPTGVTPASLLTPQQQEIERLLGGLLSSILQSGPDSFRQQLSTQLAGVGTLTDAPLKELLSGQPTDTDQLFRDSILAPSLRAFDQDIGPRIDESFSRLGASFGSRRGAERARALSDLQTNATSELARFSTIANESAKQRQLAALGIPLQQTLGQISGLGGLNASQLGPALQFLRGRGIQNFGDENFAEEGIGSQLLGFGGTALGKGG